MKFSKPDVISWNAMIGAYAEIGCDAKLKHMHSLII